MTTDTSASSTSAASAAPSLRTSAPQHPIGRIPVQGVHPLVDGGLRPAKAVVGETFTVSATVFREGHDAVNATVVLTRPDGSTQAVPMDCINPGLNLWVAEVTPTTEGAWTYRVEGWSDPYGTWVHDATIKIAAGVDTELMLAEGALLFERAAAMDGRSGAGRLLLDDAITTLRDSGKDATVRLHAGTSPEVAAEMATTGAPAASVDLPNVKSPRSVWPRTVSCKSVAPNSVTRPEPSKRNNTSWLVPTKQRFGPVRRWRMAISPMAALGSV